MGLRCLRDPGRAEQPSGVTEQQYFMDLMWQTVRGALPLKMPLRKVTSLVILGRVVPLRLDQ